MMKDKAWPEIEAQIHKKTDSSLPTRKNTSNGSTPWTTTLATKSTPLIRG